MKEWERLGVPRSTWYWQIKHGKRDPVDGALRKKGRFSGGDYENPPERLAFIKEKYRHGVTDEILSEMLEKI